MTVDPTRSEPFPDVWAEAGMPADAAELERRSALALDDIDQLYGAPRDTSLVTHFLREQLPEGRVLVYGAGTHSRRLLEGLKGFPRIRIVGIVDRLADSVEEFCGYPVFLPETLGTLHYDWILLSHGTYEDEMLERLAALGVPSSRIIPIYSNPAYCDFARGPLAERLRPFAGRSMEAFVINCTSTVVVPDEILADIFPADRTLSVYAGRYGDMETSTVFETIDIQESLTALCQLVELLRPRVVYVRSIVYKNYLGHYLKRRFPELTVIHEIYDHAVMWRDDDLVQLFGMSPRTIKRLRLVEFSGAQSCDLVVSKRGGQWWTRIQERCAAPYQLYFPMLGAPDGPPQEPEARPSLVYAGFLPAPAFLTHFKDSYEFLGILEELCASMNITAELYNSGHVGPHADRIYAAYVTSYASGPVRYRRRLTYQALLNEMQRFTWGWLCDAVHQRPRDRSVVVCNRWTGYLSAGLPILMDRQWHFMAELTEQNGAGIVVDRLDAQTIIDAVRRADHVSLAAGAARLRRDLLRRNESAVEAIAKVADGGTAIKGRADRNAGR